MPRRFCHTLCIAVIGVAVGKSIAQDNTNSTPVSANGSVSTSNIVSQVIDELELGRGLFTKHCALCHGPHGEGGRGPTLAQPSLPRAGDDASLYRIIAEGIKGTQMPGVRLEGEETAHVAKYVRYLGTQPPEVIPGDPVRGARIYANKGGCVQCHAIYGEGSGFGPDLSEVGRRRSPEYLRRALVDPNAEVPQSYVAWRSDVSLPENFLFVRLVTNDGQELSGVRVNEDTFSIQIREATGAIHSYFKSELAELHKDFGKSPMPSYAEALSNDELNDLVAYLASLRNRK
jgi:putative heme-binding domain-containing protein